MTKPTVAANAYRWAHPAIEQMVRIPVIVIGHSGRR